jgi:tetraacyldisaccharide 4'-kinase
MKIYKPFFWNKPNNIISLILLPITFLVLIFIVLKKKFTRTKKFKIPILCIGNIYIGGTGKTPLSIDIANELKSLGKKPVIIKKFYKDHEDEHLLIKKREIPLLSEKDRTRSIVLAEKNFDIAILDDGFQDYEIKKDLNILCFNNKQLIGNGYVFPSGPLRESLSSIKKAQIAVINGEKNLIFETKLKKINPDLKIFYSKYKLMNQEKLKNKNILAFAGIGNPENFFDLLIENRLSVKKTIAFPDHYNFKRNEILEIIGQAKERNYTVLTTEKDFFRIKNFEFSEINSCKINLVISEKLKLMSLIKKLYD